MIGGDGNLLQRPNEKEDTRKERFYPTVRVGKGTTSKRLESSRRESARESLWVNTMGKRLFENITRESNGARDQQAARTRS